MIEGQKKCLEALAELTASGGEFCVPFIHLQNKTGYDRRRVRLYIRQLARKDLAEYHRGLCTEDGDFAGAGYCISARGIAVLAFLNMELRLRG